MGMQSSCQAILHVTGDVVETIASVLQTEVTVTQAESILAHYYSGNWSEVLRMTRGENVSLEKINIRFAVARSHLQLREFNDALCIYHELEKGPTVNSTHHRAELVKGTAQSYEGLGLIEKASTTYQRFLSSSCSKQNSRREIALIKLELARLKIKLYQLDEDLMDMLFDVLRDLLADAGFSKKHVQCWVLNKFPDFKYAQRLQFLSNPTRELAHCVYTISELFKMSGKADLARMYRAKARKFGLLMVADEDNDTETKVTILHDAGRKFGSLQYLKYAQQLLYEDSSETPQKYELAAEVCLSSGELYAQFGEKGREELETLSEDVMLQNRFNPVGDFDYEDWRTEVENCLTKIGRDESHYDYGKLNNISGDLAKQKGECSETVHRLHSKAADIFQQQQCKVESAEVSVADAKIYYEEENYEKAEYAYAQAQRFYKDTLPNNSVAAITGRGNALKMLGKEDESELVYKEAAELEIKLQERRQKVFEAIKKGQSTVSGLYLSEVNVNLKSVVYQTASNNATMHKNNFNLLV